MEINDLVIPDTNVFNQAHRRLDHLFPNFPVEWLWSRNLRSDACSIPRILPVAMQVIDLHSKGQPAGLTLFGLWTHASSDSLTAIESPRSFAGDAGFHGEQAASSWQRRMKILKDLQFIFPRRGPSGDYHHVLLINPSVAVELMRIRGQVSDALYEFFIDRVGQLDELGAVEAFRLIWCPQRLHLQN